MPKSQKTRSPAKRSASSKKRTSSTKRSARSTHRKSRSVSKKKIFAVTAILVALAVAVSWGTLHYYKGKKGLVKHSCLHRQGEVTMIILGVLFQEGFSRNNVTWQSHGIETVFTLKAGEKKAQKVYRALIRKLRYRYRNLKIRKNDHDVIRVYCGKRVTHRFTFIKPSAFIPYAEGRPEKKIVPMAPVKPAGEKVVKVAIVIDDIGNDLSIARDLLNLPVPVTLSIFPFAPYSREIAREARTKKHEILMHLPMEPEGYPGKGKDPGPGALYVKMCRKEVERQLMADLDRIPEVCGINNHMGSRFTCDPEGMRAVMEVLKKRKKIFLDSRTIAKSIGFKIAREAGIPTVSRDVFLDNTRDVKKVKQQLDHLVEIARKKGYGIGIGHPHRATYLALKKAIPEYRKAGVKFVYITSLTR